MKIVSDTVREDISHYCGNDLLDARFYMRFFFTLSLHIILIYRLGHYLRSRGSFLRFLNFPLKYLIQVLSGSQISFSASIGQRFHMAHPTGVIIGHAVTIGDDVIVYQNVTLGGKSRNEPEYPVIEDGVTIFANSMVLGDITVGEGSTVGACSLVLKDVPAQSTISGVPGEIH